MSWLTLNGAVVARSALTLPLTGRWTAEVLLIGQSQKPVQGDRTELRFQDGTTYRGTCERSGADGVNWRVLLIAGTGGLGAAIPARYYHDIPAATIARDLVKECGEEAGDIDLPETFAHWVRPAGPAHEALVALLQRFTDRTWRFGTDGKVWIGAESWPDFETPLLIETDSEDPAQGRYTGQAVPKLQPGYRVTFERGRERILKRAVRVTHLEDEDEIRTQVFFADGLDSGSDAFRRLAEQAVRHVDFMALYPCDVLKDHGDMTLDVQPHHPRLPAMTKVRLLQPVAGARVKVKAGAVVLLEFQHGDAARPTITGYGMADLELFEVATGKGQLFRLDDDRGQTSDDHTYAAPKVLLQDAAGQVIELSAQKGEERIRVQDQAGQTVILNPKAGITMTDKAGSITRMDGAGNITLTATVHVEIDAPTVGLAGGGPPVARLGDSVQVIDPQGGIGVGTITSGSARVVSG